VAILLGLTVFFLNTGLEMDIRDLKFDTESFDAIIDKGSKGYTRRKKWISKCVFYRYYGCFDV
jgi:hypothetical protein